MKINWATPFINGRNFAIFFATVWLSAFFLAALLNVDNGALRIILAIVLAYALLEALARSGQVEPRKRVLEGNIRGEDSARDSSIPHPPPTESIPTQVSGLDRAYEVLQVHPNCTDELLKAAHRHHVSQWHPDKLSNAPEELRAIASERLASINAAYDTICDSRKASAR